jgi:hypothetical protein
MKNLKGGRPRLPLKIGANPKIFNLSKTPLETWDALTLLEAVDCTSPPEDVFNSRQEINDFFESTDKTRGRSLEFSNPSHDKQF